MKHAIYIIAVLILFGCRSGTTRKIYGSYDSIWHAVMTAKPWFSSYPEAFDYDSGRVRIRRDEIGTARGIEIDIDPHNSNSICQHLVHVYYWEWTPGLFFLPAPRGEYEVHWEANFLKQVKQSLDQSTPQQTAPLDRSVP